MSRDRAEPLHLRSSPDKSSESVDRLLLERFKKLSRFPEAFSSVQYWGTQTLSPPTDFCGLQNKLEQLLDNNATRSPRTPAVVFKALQVRVKAASRPASHVTARFFHYFHVVRDNSIMETARNQNVTQSV